MRATTTDVSTRQLRVGLVSMPWHSLDRPSIALGILATAIAETCDVEPDVHYLNLDFVEALAEVRGDEAAVAAYNVISEEGMFHGVGDWVFAAALHGTRHWRADDYLPWVRAHGHDIDGLAELQPFAADFVAEQAAKLAGRYDVIGLTNTFMQNAASLALAQALRAIDTPTIVMGGHNCEGVQGESIMRAYDAVDVVVRGEGERAVVDVLRALAAVDREERLAGVPGVCFRDGAGRLVVNEMRAQFVAPDDIPRPDFDAYFARVQSSPVRADIAPKLVLEAARGCWWGEKSHCRFCGLNGLGMRFRSRDPERVWEEMRDGVERHGVLDVITVDNIMDARYPERLMPLMATSDYDLRVHWEVKSDLTEPELAALSAARVAHIQPGIESLSSRVLKLMGKGVTAAQNVRLLRDAEQHGLTVSWNWLFGFPSETGDDYRESVRQAPALVHLQPPNVATRIALERFSPYFDDPSLGFDARTPAPFYAWIYDLPEAELEDFAFFFDAPEHGIRGAAEAELYDVVSAWQDGYAESALMFREIDGEIWVDDRRVGWPGGIDALDEEEAAVFRALRLPMKPDTVVRTLRAEARAEAISRAIARLSERGLVFHDGGRLVRLPIPAAAGAIAGTRPRPVLTEVAA